MSQTWQIPGSRRTLIRRAMVRDWLASYKAMGLEGLKPQPRPDAGRSRALPEPMQNVLLALRTERPQAPVESLLRAVRLFGRGPGENRASSGFADPRLIQRVAQCRNI